MLKGERIEEAKINVKSYLSDGLIKKENFKELIYNTYVRNFQESLNLAEKLFKEKDSSLWLIVVSYYSMFYIANAVLYKLGYKVGHKIAHKITADALIVYVKDRLKDNLIENYEKASEEALAISENLIQTFDFERSKRSRIQYETTEEIKQSKAETSFKRAKEFSFEMEKILTKF